jgi:undecaprenyl-diphosphatase
MTLIEGVLLGLVQGITEFLPISSSGHLVLVREFFEIEAGNALAFDGMLHLATAVAVLMYFWTDVWTLIQAALRKLSRLPVNERDLTLFYALLIGTLPAVLIGLLLEPYFNTSLQSAGVVAVFLFIASVFFMYAEWRYYNRPANEGISVRKGLLVGLFQVLALLPGFSRSGATIAGGMLLGLSRYEAARFSFLLAMPVTLGVGIKKMLELITLGHTVTWMPIIAGSLTAMAVALIVIHYFLAYIRKYTLWPFIWYGVVLAALVGYVSLIV